MLSDDPRLERIAIGAYIIVIAFLFIVIRLWQLQILDGSEYRKISESNRLRPIGVPAPRGIIFDRNGVPLVKNKPYFCASVIPEDFNRDSLPYLARVLNMPEVEIRKKITRKGIAPFTPVPLREGLTFQEVSFIEARKSDFPGLQIDVEVSREYIYGSVGAHAIGYLGKLTPAQLQDPQFNDVPREAFIGQWGVERLYDKTLRGTAGQKIVEVDALGRQIRLIDEVRPVKGTDIQLSLDMAVQKAAEDAFEGRAGAVVALKPDDGEILAMVSAPSFDPNKFAKGIDFESWTSLSSDQKLPMLNRAIQSQYPPGSTFKIILATAGLAADAITDSTVVDCRGGINFGKWHFGCWKKGGHRAVSLHRAIVESCDVYFYEVGKRLGIDKIHDCALELGLGKETGISFGTEKKGLIPSTEWKRETKNDQWYLGETFVNSIGQGYVAATPVQMAVMISAVANGGSIYRPEILKNAHPELVSKADIRPEILEHVRHDLEGVVNEPGGTAGSARSEKVRIGGKTGTAQVVGIRKDSKLLAEKFRDHAWFVAFAPAEKPDIALSVLVEHGGHGGSAAAPIAKKAIEAYMLTNEKKKEFLNVQN